MKNDTSPLEISLRTLIKSGTIKLQIINTVRGTHKGKANNPRFYRIHYSSQGLAAHGWEKASENFEYKKSRTSSGSLGHSIIRVLKPSKIYKN